MAETDMKMMKKKAELIFLPSMGMGHLYPALELARLLISRGNDLSITILCWKNPLSPSAAGADSHTRSVLASQPQIKLVDLPEIEPPPHDLLQKSAILYVWTFMESLKPHVKATMHNILSSLSNPVVGFVLDFFCVTMIDVGNELGIPCYMYMTSNVGFLAFMLSLQDRRIEEVFNKSDPDLLIKGISNPVPARVLPDAALHKDGGYFAYYKFAQRFRDSKGIIVNSFSELEHYAIDALLSDARNPPIYPVGPLIDLKSQPIPQLDQEHHNRILKWLHEQPPCSVVFLCFGSRGSFGPSQTREIALALGRSGVRFLWAMRSPQFKDDEDRALPEGFMEWIEGKGMICEWAPQVEVLSHKAIGGFVSHCGWNSILESLWFGVPMLTWPIYAEQQLNAFRMVREFGLAVELKLDYRSGSDLVTAEEIEKGLKHLMDRDNVARDKMQEMKDMARKAVLSGGSSFISVGDLIGNMIGSN